jgi:SAM-dependent methyltransferase
MTKTFDQGKEEITKLCQYFTTNRQAFLAPGVKEAHVRQSLIDPFFEALGWDVRNTSMVAPQYREVVPEDSLEVEGQQKAPDYAFRVGASPKFYAEAKKCDASIDTDPRWAFQLRRYGWSAKVAVSILTDFEELSVYDCTLRPHPGDKASHARILHFGFEEYPGRWRELWDVFSREAVWSGAFDQYAASKRKRGTSEVDVEFLKEIEAWREALARNMALRDKDLSPDDLNAAVQLTIDRVVFLRMGEDRGVEPYEQLLKLCERPDIYARFMRELCRKADEKYNSGLFHFQNEPGVSDRPDRITPKLTVDDRVFKPILQSLYFAHGSPYHFGVMPVEILGTVYERFLGKVIRLTAGHQAKVEEKPEVRKAGGVYYTPAYIVEYIVRHTVGRQIDGKSPAQLAGGKGKPPFRVLDMACGSGSFLLVAYQCLLGHCLKWYTEHKPESFKKAVYRDPRSGEWRLTIEEKSRILTTHLFGVDIDPRAVEVSKLSLLLKALEGEDDATLSMQRTLFYLERALPNLADNIKCGNSLIGPHYFTGTLFPGADEMQRVNPFDWNKELPDAMKAGGFDCIIGNPPYLNVDDTWGKGDSRLDALKTLYPHIYNDKTDILFYFLAQSVRLCKGSACFIVSRAFLEAYKADKLRGYLASRTAVREIIDFRNFYVFPGVGITTCIVTFDPNVPTGAVRVYKLRATELRTVALTEQLADSRVFEHISVSHKTLNESPWVLTSRAIGKLNATIDAAGKTLDKILIVGKGMETGRNNVFGNRTLQEIVNWRLKPGMFYKRASNSDIRRYFIRNRGEYVVYPQSATAFDQLPAKMQKHLADHATELKSRAAYKRGDCEWWKFTWPLHEQYYDRKRIICPYLAASNRFAPDTQKEFLSLTDTTVLFENGQAEDLLYLLGLLNSKLLDYRFKSIGKLKSGGIYEYFWNSVSKLPIRRIDFSSPADKATHERIVNLVESMLGLHRRLAGAKSEAQKASLRRQIDATDAEIDRLVYDLYGLTAKEIAIVEDGR